MRKIVFKNFSSSDVKLCFAEKQLVVKVNECIETDFDDDSFTLDIYEYEEEKSIVSRIIGSLFLILFSVLVMIICDDTIYTSINKYIKLPLTADVSLDDKSKAVVCIKDYDITVDDCPIITNKLYDKSEIKRQIKAYHRETALIFIVPILFFAAIAVYSVVTKNLVVVLVSAAIFVIIFIVWLVNHRKNDKYIQTLFKKCSK